MNSKDLKELEQVTVTNYNQLVLALEPFTKDTTIRKLLVEGMDIVKRQQEFANSAIPTDTEAFGGFMPARPSHGHHYSWVDTLINKRMNGKREGLVIKWTLPDGNFTFDPWTKKLEKQ